MKSLLLCGTLAELNSTRAKKVLAVASCACIPVPTKVLADFNDDPSSYHKAIPHPMGLVLCIGDDLKIVMVNGMIRQLASMVPTSGLLGSTTFEEAQVESWMSYLWHSLELPLHVLGEAEAKGRGDVSNHIHSQLRVALARIESHLKRHDSSCLVGRSTTVADISLAVALKFNGHLLHEFMSPYLGSWVNKIDGKCHLSKWSAVQTGKF